MAARSHTYRRLAIEADQQRARASDPEVQQGFADIADHWAGLAEQSDWLEAPTKLDRPTATGNINRPTVCGRTYPTSATGPVAGARGELTPGACSMPRSYQKLRREQTGCSGRFIHGLR